MRLMNVKRLCKYHVGVLNTSNNVSIAHFSFSFFRPKPLKKTNIGTAGKGTHAARVHCVRDNVRRCRTQLT